jgi:hypothetical protein
MPMLKNGYGWSFAFTLLILPLNALGDQERVEWREGADFRRQLQKRVGLTTPNTPVWKLVERLANQNRVAVFLDRRVDPTRQVKLSVIETPLIEALRRIAQDVGADVCYLDPIVYIGPAPIVARLSTVAALKREQANALQPTLKKKWLASKPWGWRELATPRELLDELAAEAALKVVDGERLPHDLWPARDLPSLALIDRISLILAGFSLTVEIAADGTVVKLVPVPPDAQLVRRYRFGAELWQATNRLQKRFTDAEVRRAGKTIVVRGSYELHFAIQQYLRGEVKPPRGGANAEKRYTMDVQHQPVGAVLKTVAIQDGLQIDATPEAAQRFRELVSFKLEQVTLDKLLATALTPAGLTFELDGRRLAVTVVNRTR